MGDLGAFHGPPALDRGDCGHSGDRGDDGGELASDETLEGLRGSDRALTAHAYPPPTNASSVERTIQLDSAAGASDEQATRARGQSAVMTVCLWF